MAVLAIWTDRGVRKDLQGGHHIDKKRDNEGLPYLFVNEEATHALLFSDRLQLYNNQVPGWMIRLDQAPDDWILAAQQSSTIYLISGSEPNAEEAARNLDSIAARAIEVPIKSGISKLATIEELARDLSLVIPEFDPSNLNPLTNHRIKDQNTITLTDLVAWGLTSYLPKQIKGYPANQAFHLLSDCAGTYSSRKVDLKTAVKHACPRCGMTKDRNLLQLDEYDPLNKLASGIGKAMANAYIISQEPLSPLALMQLETVLYRMLGGYKFEHFKQVLGELLVHTQYAIQESIFKQNNTEALNSIRQYGELTLTGPLSIIKVKANNGWPDAAPARAALAYYGYLRAPRSREIFTIIPSNVYESLIKLPGVSLEFVSWLWPQEDYTTVAPLVNISRDTYSLNSKVLAKLRHDQGLYHPYKPFGARSEVKGGIL